MKLGIICAMDVEAELLCDALQQPTTTHRAHTTFMEGTLEGCPVVVVRSGIGKINASVCTQILIDLFGVTHIINSGAAGSLDNRIAIGDIVVSSDAVHHDVDARIFGYAQGEVPGLHTRAFPADTTLQQACVGACKRSECTADVFVGRVVSGDQFIADREKKQQLARDFKALCCEMEGASVAQTCWLNNIPFVIIRAISDKADDSQQVEYPVFEKTAGHTSAQVVLFLAEYLANTTEQH